jgi:hypothetical protein
VGVPCLPFPEVEQRHVGAVVRTNLAVLGKYVPVNINFAMMDYRPISRPKVTLQNPSPSSLIARAVIFIYLKAEVKQSPTPNVTVEPDRIRHPRRRILHKPIPVVVAGFETQRITLDEPPEPR